MCLLHQKTPHHGFQTQFHREVCGYHTEFVFQKFANRWLLLITQYGRLPNLYTIKFDYKNSQMRPRVTASNDSNLHSSVAVTMKCTFGADKDETQPAIQFLVDKTKLNQCSTELLVGLGLKEYNATLLRAIVDIINGEILE